MDPVSNSAIDCCADRNQTHFVLLTGVNDTDTFNVNDPFYNSTTYTYDEIHDIIMYNVSAKPATQIIPKAYPLYKQCDSVCLPCL